MDRRVIATLAALAAVACGDAFTTATNDGGTTPGPDAAFDAAIDTGVADARPPTQDAEMRDAPSDQPDVGGGQGDGAGPPPVVDGGVGIADAGASCVRTCPSGFDCVLGKCEDRAETHFSINPSFNWSYGSFAEFGSSAFSPYATTWMTNGLVFVSRTRNVLPLSVFHSTSAVDYEGMSIPPDTLGLVPQTMSTDASVVRWSAPVGGTYAITAVFTGLGVTPATNIVAGVNIGQGNVFGQTIGAGPMPMNSVAYTDASETLQPGATIDFYVSFVTAAGDDLQGGTSLDVRITTD